MSQLTAERWLSPHRLQVYLDEVGGDVQHALDLYDWNARVAAACMQDVGHFEVLVRNRYDDELRAKFPSWTSTSDLLWSTTQGVPAARAKQQQAHAKSMKGLKEAHSRAPAPTPGHIIANLSFGFWAALTRPERESTLWTPMLSKTFPGKRRGPIHAQMQAINHFRNRLAHWEPVFSTTTGLSKQLDDFADLFRATDTDVASWVGTRSSVLTLFTSVPSGAGGIALPRKYLGQ